MNGLRRLLFPRPVSSFRGVDVFRCRTDNALVTMKSLEDHGGHYLLQPVVLTLFEKLLICLKIVT